MLAHDDSSKLRLDTFLKGCKTMWEKENVLLTGHVLKKKKMTITEAFLFHKHILLRYIMVLQLSVGRCLQYSF